MIVRVLALSCSMILMMAVAVFATDGHPSAREDGAHSHSVGARQPLTASSETEVKLRMVDLDQRGGGQLSEDDTTDGALIIYHREGKRLEKQDAAAVVPGEIQFPSQATATVGDANGQRNAFLVALAVYQSDGLTFTELAYDDALPGEFNLDQEAARVVATLLSLLQEVETPHRVIGRDDLETASAPSGTTHITSFSGTCRDSANGYVSAGNLSNVFTQVSRGTATYNDKGATLWDSRARHTSTPYNNYQTREIRTRHDQGHWFSQDIIPHGPYTTTSGSSVTVTLGVKGPTISWTFNKPSVRIYDTTSFPNYSRWVFDIVLGTDSSRYTYVSEPGLRLVNTVGQVAFRNQVHMYYYRNLSHYCMMNVGPVDRWFNDR